VYTVLADDDSRCWHPHAWRRRGSNSGGTRSKPQQQAPVCKMRREYWNAPSLF